MASAILQPHLVSHHAAQIDVKKCLGSLLMPSQYQQSLRRGRVRTFGSHMGRVIFASSGGAMCGEQDVHPAPETHPVRPETLMDSENTSESGI